MEDKIIEPGKFANISNYKIRKTGEEVIVIDFNQESAGVRNENDWVSYIDSNGVEHFMEPLNISFDFEAVNNLMNTFENFMNLNPLPDVWEIRIYELVKAFVVEKDMPVEEAINKAMEIKSAIIRLNK